MRNRLHGTLDHLNYLRRIGMGVMTRRALSKTFAAVCRYDTGYLLCVDLQLDAEDAYTDRGDTVCSVIDTVDSYRSKNYSLDTSFPFDEVLRHLEDRRGNFAVIASKVGTDATEEMVVGYFLCVSGHFRLLEIEGSLPPDTLSSSTIVVMPEYRGQRIAQMMRDVADAYCSEIGLRKRISAVLDHNLPSLRNAHRKSNVKIIGRFRHISFFRGMWTGGTTIEEIREMIRESDSPEKEEHPWPI